MCVSVSIPCADAYCQTIGEIRAALTVIVFELGMQPKPGDCDSCLCYLNPTATAHANGMICRRDKWGDWEFRFVPPPGELRRGRERIARHSRNRRTP